MPVGEQLDLGAVDSVSAQCNIEIQKVQRSTNTVEPRTVSSEKPWRWLSGLVDRPHNGGIVLLR